MKLCHNVYFSLKDKSKPAIGKLLADCQRYLNVQKGIEFFACGVLAAELTRPVNDREWDVALHLVFASEADQAAYQTDATHLKFIAENKDNWAKVRVFDTLLSDSAK